jgi:MerR family transcriptional regulator, copper efflux regulator
MARDGLLIGEVATRTGVSRKAVRLYEASGILPASRRTAGGYRVFEPDTEATLAFVMQARRLGFGLGEIKDIVTIKRSGGTPCPHVREAVRRKARDLDSMLRRPAGAAPPAAESAPVIAVRPQEGGRLPAHRTRGYHDKEISKWKP